jgi:predicted nucleic-acid-binding Zn-ribbon protein
MSQQPEDDVDDFDPMDVYTMEDFMEEDAILEEFRRELGEELKANIDAESSTVTCRHRRHSTYYCTSCLYVRFYKKNLDNLDLLTVHSLINIYFYLKKYKIQRRGNTNE